MAEFCDCDVRDAVVEWLTRTTGVHADHVGVSVNHGVVTLSGQVDTFAEKDLIQNTTLEIDGVRVLADELTVRDNLGAVRDPDIARRVADTVARAVDDAGSTVKVVVRQGVVTLTGTVASPIDHQALVGAVAALPSVARVLDNLRIDPAAAAADIRRAISSRLVHNAQLDSNHIHVDVLNGVATLSGTVRSPDERQQAERVARGAPRIREVRNLLRIGR
jgi:osmotically-inducible protein OsmY